MSNDPNVNPEPLIACNFNAIDPAQRGTHEAVVGNIFASVLEIRELANGYGFRLPPETPMLYKTIEFVANERLCCPFFTFNLVITEEQFWLELSGTEAVKGYIHDGIVQPIVETGAIPQEMIDFIKAGNPLREIGRVGKG